MTTRPPGHPPDDDPNRAPATAQPSATSLREKLRAEVLKIPAADLLPHHRRHALLFLDPGVDLLDVAVDIAADNKTAIQTHLSSGTLRPSTLQDMANYCSNPDLQFQFVIIQPLVLAQVLA